VTVEIFKRRTLEDMAALMASDAETEGGQGMKGGDGDGNMNTFDLSQYDIPSSPELECVGCPLTSKSQCPIAAARKETARRCGWARTSTRKVTGAGGKGHEA